MGKIKRTGLYEIVWRDIVSNVNEDKTKIDSCDTEWLFQICTSWGVIYKEDKWGIALMTTSMGDTGDFIIIPKSNIIEINELDFKKNIIKPKKKK